MTGYTRGSLRSRQRTLKLAALILSSVSAIPFATAAPTVGAIDSSPSFITVGAATQISVTVQITDPTVLATGVNLLQVDVAGNNAATLGVMHDDGLNGDIKSGDGIFTFSVPLNPKTATPLYFQASAAFKGVLQRVKSSILTLPVLSGPAGISGFSPGSAPIGTLVTASLGNFAPPKGAVPQVTLASLTGGTLAAPVSTYTASSLSFVIPAGAGTGKFTVSWATQTATSATPLTVATSSTFSLSFGPATGKLIQGQSVTYAITVDSANGFTGFANLAVAGVPNGIQYSFKPTAITAGQTSVLTLNAPASQAAGTTALTVTAAATIDGQSVSQTASANLQVVGITTSFLGRTVVDNAEQTPIAGVTVKFMGKDASGRTTGCSGQTLSDAGGNFSLTNLAQNCIGPQLISYDGMTATSPAGKYAGVNLSYTLVSGQVTTSPVLIHLPRIDNGETVQVQQNLSTDQVFTFQTIPGLTVTVYAGTAFALDDGSQPNPFPLIALNIPLDRLPDQMPTSRMLMPFIVAFQPANATASQPVAVNFPNSFGTAPGTHVTFMTLDPTRGVMVPYGTGTVSNDGTRFLADADPAHAGHAYGIVHFDWHGPSAPPPPNTNPSPDGGCSGSADTGPVPLPAPPACQVAGPVDVASGIVSYSSTDLGFASERTSVYVRRSYRTLSTNPGPFGIGTGHNYSYALDIFPLLQGQAIIRLLVPDGNQFVFTLQQNGTYINTSVPAFRGAVITQTTASASYTLRWMDGTQFRFDTFPSTAGREAFLTSVIDSNGNRVSLNLNPLQPLQITAVSDGAGRALTLAYDTFNRITSISDSAGRQVLYFYNSQGTLARFTDALGGITNYTYDSANRITSITDPRGVLTEQNTYNAFDGRIAGQMQADGGRFSFSYTLQNPSVPTSAILQTVVTDPLGAQTTYRFDTQGFLVSVIDALGQQRTLLRDPSHNNLVSKYVGGGVCSVCGNPSLGDITYSFDAAGNVETRTDSLNNVTSSIYEATFNKVTSISDQSGASAQLNYDSSGNLSKITFPRGNTITVTRNAFGQMTAYKNSSGHQVSVLYDVFGNLTGVTDQSGNTATTTYDALSRPIQSVDSLGRSTFTTYDALGRIVAVVNNLKEATQFSYDAVGNLLTISDALGNVTRLAYDSMNRLSRLTDAAGNIETRTYDMNGNLVKFVDRRGQVTTAAYDVLNRPIRQTYSDGSTVSETYDSYSRPISIADSLSGVFTFKYDSSGNLTATTNQFGSIYYVYDSDKRVIRRQVAGQPPAIYSYDFSGNVTDASLGPASVHITMDSSGKTSVINRGNGISSTYQYDNGGRLASIVHATPGTPIVLTYGYGGSGDLARKHSTLDQPLSAVSATSNVGVANRIVSTSALGSARTLSYDANGNVSQITSVSGVINYTWDARNRLSSVSQVGGLNATFMYDFANNLIQVITSVGGVTEQQNFLVDDITNVAHINSSRRGNIGVLGGRSLDQHLALVYPNGTVEYGLVDGINSTIAVYDQASAQVAAITYDLYGLTPTASTYPFQFAGRMPVVAGLYYFRARFYDSTMGRFISEDPLGIQGGVNAYVYAGDDPLGRVDPTGLGGCFVDYPDYPITIPGTSWKTTLTPGHAGVLGYDNSTGQTRYYEYGRYDKAQAGIVRRKPVPDLEIGPDGNPTPESLADLQSALSKVAGEGTRAVLSCSSSADPKKIYKYAEDLMANKSRAPYSWNPFHSNTCRDFAQKALNAGGK